MLVIMIMFTLLISSMALVSFTHPVSMAGVLVVVALLSSILLGKMVISWVFYLLALVFLGGVMVVLLFMVSVCANEKFFTVSNNNLAMGLGGGLLFSLLLNKSMIISTDVKSNLLPMLLYQSESAFSFILFMSVLVLCMISVVKVSKLESGPLVKRLLKISMKITFYLQ